MLVLVLVCPLEVEGVGAGVGVEAKTTADVMGAVTSIAFVPVVPDRGSSTLSQLQTHILNTNKLTRKWDVMV